MARIKEHHPELGEHLERTIRTGTYCSYLPDTRPSGVGHRHERSWRIAATPLIVRVRSRRAGAGSERSKHPRSPRR